MNGMGSTWRQVRRVFRRRGPLASVGGHADQGDGGGTGDAGDAFWALKNISLDIQPGEVLGLIGRNGAGKSTLLKVLSRITPPTGGWVDVRGRIGSLLEVGTGFHQELTGRENIYLSGAILGLGARDIERKFDAIVDFAEIESFLDTPVKRYSSGMYMRLAFSVAAHLDPEILLVDEVLAVGDMAFQKKCLGKMDEVRRSHRTIIFVSHNMTAIKSLCTRAVLIEEGRVARDGNVDDAVNTYLAAGTNMSRTGIIPENAPRISTGAVRLRSVRVTDLSGREVSQLYFGQRFRVRFTCDVLEEIPSGVFEVSISTLDGAHVACSMTTDGGNEGTHLAKGTHAVEVEMENVLLPRDYTIDLGVHYPDGVTADFVQRTFDFSVLRVAENGSDHFRWNTVRGYVRQPGRWSRRRPGEE
jgi:lipopolysaccharide transport system ATP-binding protein